LLFGGLVSCSRDNEENKEVKNLSKEEKYIEKFNVGEKADADEQKNENVYNGFSESDCNFSDGTYSSSVDYYNPETDYSHTYTLDVEVEDCQVIQIDFPKGVWLDEDHISFADLDENGEATVMEKMEKPMRSELIINNILLLNSRKKNTTLTNKNYNEKNSNPYIYNFIVFCLLLP
jgi:hypothetical protein